MNQYYDYCDTYDNYGICESGRVMGVTNQIKTFSCSICKQSKLVLKKSVGEPVFRCDECIEASFHHNNHLEQSQVQQQNQTQETRCRWFSFF